MPTQLQLRRGNTAQTSVFTGVTAEITVDTDKKTLVVHDGSTAGGIPLAKESALTTIYAHANGAFDKANSSNVIAQAAFDKANQTAQLAFTTVSANGTSLTADANNDTLTITSAVANGVFVTGNSSTDALDIGLIDSGVTASGYGDSISVPTFVVDAKGRLTSASNTTIRSGTTSQTGVVQLQDSFTSTSTSNAATPASVKTTYDLATTANNNAVNAGTYANAAFDKANSANVLAQSGYNQANTATTTAGLAYTHANGAFDKANSANILAQSGYNQANTATTTAGLAYTHANGAFDKANTATTTADAAFAKANSANVIAQAAFDNSNTKFSSSGGSISGDVSVTGNLTIIGQTIYANTTTALIADNVLTLNAAINQASSPTVNAGVEVDRGSSANVSLLWNETSDKWTFTNDGTTYYDIADAARLDSSFTHANGAFDKANTATTTAGLAYTHANGAFTTANSATTTAQNAYNLANGTAIVANTDFTTISATAGVYGNAAYLPVVTLTANGRVSSITNTAIIISADAITSGTLAVARGGTGVTTSTGTGAVVLNTAPTLSNVSVTGLITVSDNVRANYVVANTAFTSAAGASKLELSDIGLVGISVAGQTYQFGASGLESNQGIFGGSFGGNRLSLNNETNLISNRYDTVKIQTGTDGTTVNDFTFANNSLTVPGLFTTVSTNITSTTASTSNTTGALKVAGGVGIKGNVYADAIYDGGIEVISFANQAFTQANSANVLAQAAFDKANTDTTSISATAGVYGNASIVPVFTLAANGRVSAVTNTAIAIDTSAITSGTIADARLPTKVSVGTFGNSTTAITLTVDAQGRITAISQSAITLTESDPTALAFAIALG
jgi:hypothetical protein